MNKTISYKSKRFTRRIKWKQYISGTDYEENRRPK